MKKKFLLSFIALSITLTGCLKEGSETIALPFGRVPNTVIPDEIRDQLEHHMPIYEGITPPDISGKYLVKPNQLVYSSDGQFSVGYVFAPSYISFENQTASGMATYTEKCGSSTSESSDVYIVGSGNGFTAYFMTHEIHYDDNGDIDATCTTSNVVSGTITANGISNYRLAFVMLEKNDPNNTLMDVNEFRVVEDGDGLAARHNWNKSEKTDSNLPARCIRKSNN